MMKTIKMLQVESVDPGDVKVGYMLFEGMVIHIQETHGAHMYSTPMGSVYAEPGTKVSVVCRVTQETAKAVQAAVERSDLEATGR